MLTSEFDFLLPQESIAVEPVEPRDHSQLLFSDNAIIQHVQFNAITQLLREGDLLVFNNTKVIPARLHGLRNNSSKIELTLNKKNSDGSWSVFAKPTKRVRKDDTIIIDDEFRGVVTAKHENGLLDIQFAMDDRQFFACLQQYGEMPLPPYIAKQRKNNHADKTNYQTVYAEKPGAIAAPTAGLHFTDSLLNKLKQGGIATAFLTLHVGAGTFLPVKSENIDEHHMHSEYYEIPKNLVEAVKETRKRDGRVIAVGTTSVRALESASDNSGNLRAECKETDIFITPGYQFKQVDAMITNFHLPQSTLLMLVSAFAGMQHIRDVYRYAIENKLRFYSYGDACFLERSDNPLES